MKNHISFTLFFVSIFTLNIYYVSNVLAQSSLTTREDYVENYSDFSNPERGFHTTSNSPSNNGSDVGTFEVTTAAWTPAVDETTLRNNRVNLGISVHAMRYNIAAFRYSSLSTDFLNRISEDFARTRRAGVKLIPRFLYSFNGARPDASKA